MKNILGYNVIIATLHSSPNNENWDARSIRNPPRPEKKKKKKKKKKTTPANLQNTIVCQN